MTLFSDTIKSNSDKEENRIETIHYPTTIKLKESDFEDIQIRPFKPDLLCFSEEDNALVVVEIKSEKEKAEHKTFGQILYYIMSEKKYNIYKDKVKSIRGMILAHDIDDSLKELIKEYRDVIPHINLITYHKTVEGEFDFKPDDKF